MNLVAKTIHEGDGMIVELGLSVLVFLNCYTLRSTDAGILFPESQVARVFVNSRDYPPVFMIDRLPSAGDV